MKMIGVVGVWHALFVEFCMHYAYNVVFTWPPYVR